MYIEIIIKKCLVKFYIEESMRFIRILFNQLEVIRKNFKSNTLFQQTRDKNLETEELLTKKRRKKLVSPRKKGKSNETRIPNARSPTNHKSLSTFNIPERTSKIHLMKTHILPYSI